MTDPMRVFAWALIALGVVVVIAAQPYTSWQQQQIREREYRAAVSGYNVGHSDNLSPWPMALVGVGAAALGVIVLAIRRPELGPPKPQPTCPHCGAEGLRGYVACPKCQREFIGSYGRPGGNRRSP